jgi:hypothetical protein
MTTHSDAAKEYASSRWQDDTIGWFEAAGDFDAGAAYDAPPLKAWERELLGAVPAPVLLTDPDDPRIKSGALVSITQSYGDDGESNTYTRRICTTSGWGVLGVRGRIAEGQRALLLAEAPDPDADVRVALNLASRDNLDEMLANLREHGWDVVKVARS